MTQQQGGMMTTQHDTTQAAWSDFQNKLDDLIFESLDHIREPGFAAVVNQVRAWSKQLEHAQDSLSRSKR
jgi:hypothetical protein